MPAVIRRLVVRRVLPVALGFARALLPAARHVVVTGYPATEGNVIELVRALIHRYPGRIIWFRAPTPDILKLLGIADPNQRILRLKRDSIAGLWYYSTAEAVFFTHGLYGEPPSLARKPIINLWHGGGPKKSQLLFPDRRLRSAPADYLVAATKLWGEELARASGMDSRSLLLTGSPRNDALFRPAEADALSSLGVEGAFVVWMPSYRSARQSGTMLAWSDTSSPSSDASLGERMQLISRSLEAVGVKLVVKPHPLDAVSRSVDGAVIIDESRLASAGVSLYGLLASSSGLITDVSSVFVDYVVTGRPIGFFFPDAVEYEETRGFFPSDFLEWLPGFRIDAEDGLVSFVEDVVSGGARSEHLRRVFLQRSGTVVTSNAANELLSRLAAASPSRFARRIKSVEEL